MPSIPKLRRTLFALYKHLGIAEDMRHDVQFAHTGKASLRDWTPADYDQAIAALQRAAGQHRDERAHVREDRTSARQERPGWATREQAAYIEDLCDRIEWTRGRRDGPRLYAATTILAGDRKALRRARLKDAYDGEAARSDRLCAWLDLTRQEASDLIKALRKAARVYPRETSRVY